MAEREEQSGRSDFEPAVAPENRRRPFTLGMVGVVGLAALVAAGAGLVQLYWHARVFAGRVGFPLDLEWMEGGMLVHAQRIAHGLPVYQAPSVDFIPFLYTPFYPAVVAALSKIFPLGYVLGRTVSLLAFTGALGFLVAAAVRQAAGDSPSGAVRGPQRFPRSGAALVALAGAGVVAAGFTFSGAFYDLARSDSLLLFLEAAALFAAVEGKTRTSAIVAGVAIALAFFTKQTASVIGISVGVGLLLTNWRRGVVYGAVAAVVLGVGILGLTKATGGWFWTYVFKLHQSHAFNRNLAFSVTPLRIWQQEAPLLMGLGAVTIGLGLARQLRRSDVILWAAAIGGFVSACVGFGTQWAFVNAYIPAVYFPAFAATVLGARLVAHALQVRRVGVLALACVCPIALGTDNVKAGRPDAATVPQMADRASAQRFLERLRELPGDGYIPFHPFYSTLVGKRPFVHRMSVMDVGALVGRPAGLDQSIAEQKFPFVILDWKSQPGEWPYLDGRYHMVHEFREGVDAVRVFSGAQTWPSQLLVPTRDPPALPSGAVKIADFESGRWNGWSASGNAFGPTPAPAWKLGAFGRFAADSVHDGTGRTGTLRSPPITIDRPNLRLSLNGPSDPGLRVLLLDGPGVVREASTTAAPMEVTWHVGDLLGHQVVLLIEDNSPAAGLIVDEIVAY